MMMNLFSIFDPSTQIFSLELNWLSVSLMIMFISLSFWTFPSRMKLMFFSLYSILKKEFQALLGPTNFIGITLFPISILLFILLNNVMGLMPYIFTATSHPIMTLSLALPLWISLIIYGWTNHTIHMLAHLVPLGTPMALMMFMVCIETISNIIRPITLSIRLAANMIAGHLLMTLLGNQAPSANLVYPLILITQICLLTLESAVALIQSYVFAVLSTLYLSET